jgi:hypothetical protein
VGHQDYFLASLPGSEALLKSGIGKGNFRCEYCFYFCPLFYFAMEKSPFGSLFGNTTATITVVDKPPPAQLDSFKIPMKIVKRVIKLLALIWRSWWSRDSNQDVDFRLIKVPVTQK